MGVHRQNSGGFLVTVIFGFNTLICGLIQKDYNHARRMLSELGTLGTKTQYLFSAGMVITAIFRIQFMPKILRRC